MKSDVTFLVSSCDKYEDAWHPFFELLHIYGGDFNYPIVLNTETKQYSSPHFDIRVINTPGKKTWSERMMNVLSQIDTEYVFWVLEDYFISAPFDHIRFTKVLDYMNDNRDVGYVSIAPRVLTHDDEQYHLEEFKNVTDSFEVREYKRYMIGVVASVWRKSFFVDILRAHEDIWQFESWAAIRAKYSGQKLVRYYTRIPVIYEYNYQVWDDAQPWLGIGLTKGKWLPGNIDFFKRHGIEVDFSNLGILDVQNNADIKNYSNQPLFLLKRFMRKIRSILFMYKSLH